MSSKTRLLTALIFAISIAPLSAGSNELKLPPLEKNISGVPVTFAGAVWLKTVELCKAMQAEFDIDLTDFNARLTQIIKTSGVERNIECGDKVAIHGAHLFRRDANLGVKVDGNVGRQECVKTKVPEFRGLKVTFKTRIVARNTFETNASVEAEFDPIIIDQNAIGMRLASGPSTRVSNDVYKFLISAFNYQSRIDNKIRETITAALQDPASRFTLPDVFKVLDFSLTDASIADVEGRLALRVTGRAPVPVAIRAIILRPMGLEPNSCR